jgi:hypothetical protein
MVSKIKLSHLLNMDFFIIWVGVGGREGDSNHHRDHTIGVDLLENDSK